MRVGKALRCAKDVASWSSRWSAQYRICSHAQAYVSPFAGAGPDLGRSPSSSGRPLTSELALARAYRRTSTKVEANFSASSW